MRGRMLLRRLRQVTSFLFRKNRAEDAQGEELRVPRAARIAAAGRAAPSGLSLQQRRQSLTRRQYFDSADHFLKIHDSEKSTESKESPRKREKESPSETLSMLAPEKSSTDQAPLDKAYSKIIDEMKPKESV